MTDDREPSYRLPTVFEALAYDTGLTPDEMGDFLNAKVRELLERMPALFSETGIAGDAYADGWNPPAAPPPAHTPPA